MRKKTQVLLVALAMPALVACQGAPPGHVSMAPDVSPSASSPSSNATLRDPRADLEPTGSAAINPALPAIVDVKGHERGDFSIAAEGAHGNVVVTLTCDGPGRYTVSNESGLVLSSGCGASHQASITIKAAALGHILHVVAPGHFWLLVAPAAE